MASMTYCSCPVCAGSAGPTGSGGGGGAAATATPSFIEALTFEMDAPVTVWNPTGQVFTRTYKFVQSMPTNRDWGAVTGFTPLDAAKKAVVREMLTQYSEVIPVQFVELSDTATQNGDISFGSAAMESSGGWGSYFYSYRTTGGTVSSKTLDSMVVFNKAYALDSTYGRNLVLHEVGHAFTLKHPGNYDTIESDPPGPFLPAAEDSNQYSVMSYNDHPVTGEKSGSLQLYDIAALQYRFGANTATRSGDTTYSDLMGRNMLTVWDGGGTDSFDFSSRADDLTLDLRAGAFSSVGTAKNLAIAYGVVIENARGGAGNDSVVGNGSANDLQGGAGNDTILGCAAENAADVDPDLIQGGDGNDLIFGYGGPDWLFSGTGDDTIYGGLGDDTLLGGRGADYLYGGQDNDSILSGQDSDTVESGLGNDTILAGQQDDLVLAGRGDDFIQGGLGNDTLNGALGNDTIEGNGDDDILVGGGGADLFVFTSPAGADVIEDFLASEGDRIRVAAGMAYTVSDAGSGTLVAFAGGSVLLKGIIRTSVTDSLFVTA